ncbi:MAG: hypothetical protein WC707_03700 [Candidatus Babeliaceae bacterium]
MKIFSCNIVILLCSSAQLLCGSYDLRVLNKIVPKNVFDNILAIDMRMCPNAYEPKPSYKNILEYYITGLKSLARPLSSQEILNSYQYELRRSTYEWATFLNYCYGKGKDTQHAQFAQQVLSLVYDKQLISCDVKERYKQLCSQAQWSSVRDVKMLVKKVRKHAGVTVKIEEVVAEKLQEKIS